MRSFVESLESRRLFSSMTIHGSKHENETITVALMQDGIHWDVNGESHVTPYKRNLAKITIKAGTFRGHKTHGEHTINFSAPWDAGLRVKILGTSKSVNHIHITNSAVPVAAYGGAKSWNDLSATRSNNSGTITLKGGSRSTNDITFGSGYNTIIGGSHSANVYHRNDSGFGLLTAGKKSSNVLFTPQAQVGALVIKGDVEIRAA